jgi:hypothetical protein
MKSAASAGIYIYIYIYIHTYTYTYTEGAHGQAGGELRSIVTCTDPALRLPAAESGAVSPRRRATGATTGRDRPRRPGKWHVLVPPSTLENSEFQNRSTLLQARRLAGPPRAQISFGAFVSQSTQLCLLGQSAPTIMAVLDK